MRVREHLVLLSAGLLSLQSCVGRRGGTRTIFEESEVELVLLIGFRRRLTVFLRRPPILYIANIASFVLALVQNVLIFI